MNNRISNCELLVTIPAFSRIADDGKTVSNVGSAFCPCLLHARCTRWRSWLRHCATNRMVAGSIPDGVIGIFQWLNPSGRTMALRSTRPLTGISTRNLPCDVKTAVRMADNLTTFMCQLSRNSGAWTSWNPKGLSRPVAGFTTRAEERCVESVCVLVIVLLPCTVLVETPETCILLNFIQSLEHLNSVYMNNKVFVLFTCRRLAWYFCQLKWNRMSRQ